MTNSAYKRIDSGLPPVLFVSMTTSQVNDGDSYGDQHGGYEEFLNFSGNQFKAACELSQSIHRLLAIVYLTYRSNHYSGLQISICIGR